MPQDTYLIRWPSSVSAVIAFGVLCGLFCTAASVLRRLWGALGPGAVLVAAGGWIVSMAWSQYPEVSGGLDRSHYWALFLFFALVAFVIPAGVIHRVGKRPLRPGIGGTIGYGLASGYLAMLASGIVFTLVLLIIWLLRLATP